MVSITPKSRILANGTANDATPVEQNFTDLYNNDTTLANVVTTLEQNTLAVTQLKHLNTTSCPIFVNSNSFSVAQLFCSNSLNDAFITKTTNTLVDLNNSGLNGIALSAVLNGSMSVTVGSNAVTGTSTTFTTVFQPGDVIRTAGGQARRIITVSNNTNLIVESNWTTTEVSAAYRRGGRASNTWYHLYAIGNGTGGQLFLSTRNTSASEVLLDLPSGYSKQRQLAFSVKTDGDSNLIPFVVATGWPTRSAVYYRDYERVTGLYLAVNSANTIDFVTQSLSSWVPATARHTILGISLSYATGAGSAFIRETATGFAGTDMGDNVLPNLILYHNHTPQSLNPLQQMDYKVTGGSNVGIWVRGFVITEVI